MKNNMVKIDGAVKAIAWDFDGTVLDSFNVVKEIVNEILEDEGRPPIEDTVLEKNYHGRMRDTLRILIDNNMSDAVLNEYEQKFLTKQERYYEAFDELLLQDAMALIKSCQKAGLKQIIVTNREHKDRGNASPHYLVKNSIMNESIDYVIAGDDLEHRKPDARVLQPYLEKNNILPNELLVIGDQFVDGQLAINVGAKAILVVRYGAEIPHLELLDSDWQEHVSIVKSLHEVTI